MASQDGNSRRSARRMVFIIVASVLVVSVAWTYLMGDAVVASNRAVMRQQAVIDHLKETLSTVKDAETGQRG